MKEIPLPRAEKLARMRVRVKRNCTALNLLAIAVSVLAALSMLGVLVAVIVAEFNRGSSRLLYILAGSLAGGAGVFALCAVLFSKLSARADERALDFFERCDGENSFFVGEGTLATFGEALLLHAENGGRRVSVPYGEIRAFSVCTRRRPRERGEWSVVLEIPARYLMKDGKGDPILIQTNAKERLCRALEAHNIPLLGEERKERENVKFSCLKKFYLPDRKKRKRSLAVMIVGIAAAAASVPLAIFLDAAIGAVLAVFGIFVGGRAADVFVRSRALFAIYREGVYWRESGRGESFFLKWEEIEKISAKEREGYPVLAFRCAYGEYHVPRAAGAFESLLEMQREKCEA